MSQCVETASDSILPTYLPYAIHQSLPPPNPPSSHTLSPSPSLTQVIWSAALRRHLVDMIEQHIGDFPARLRQFSLAMYDFCPIPRIHYAQLNSEIYVHEYYLRYDAL